MYDVIIIGAGVTGCSIAREISKYKVNACVVEKEEDVCCGTSKANSAIMHAGFDAEEGSLMARLNVRGNEMVETLAADLDIPFIRNGSLVVCTNEEDLPKLQDLYERGIANGVKDLAVLNREESVRLEPNLSDQVLGSLYAPTAGIICPFTMTFAFAENASQNGVVFKFNTTVVNIHKNNGCYEVKTNHGILETKYVVNAAGVYADVFHNMVSREKMKITARRGEYCLLDKSAGSHVSKTIFALPGKYGKGVLVAPTVHGNLIIGPTAADIEDKEGTNTTKEGLQELLQKAGNTVKDLPLRQTITSFAGLRAHEDHHEFIIKEAEDSAGFIDAAGMESPGLTSAPAVGEMVVDIIKNTYRMEKKSDYIAVRKGIIHAAELTVEERNELIKRQPEYGNIICRCEMISEGEILDAIHRPLGAKSLDGIKRRVRAGAGRCQAGFCTPKTMEILSRELYIPMEDIVKSGMEAKVVIGKNRAVK